MAPLLGWLGPMEIGILALVVLLLFGARKIPQLMRSLGSGMNQFKRGLREGVEGENDGMA